MRIQMLSSVLLLSFSLVACSRNETTSGTDSGGQAAPTVATQTPTVEDTSKLPLANAEPAKTNPVIQQGYSTKFTCTGNLNDTGTGINTTIDVTSTDVKDIVLAKSDKGTVTLGLNKGKMIIAAEDASGNFIGMSNSDLTSMVNFLITKTDFGSVAVQCQNETPITVDNSATFQCSGSVFPASGTIPTVTLTSSDKEAVLFNISGKFSAIIKRYSTYLVIDLIDLSTNKSVGQSMITTNSSLLEFASDVNSTSRVSIQCLKK